MLINFNKIVRPRQLIAGSLVFAAVALFSTLGATSATAAEQAPETPTSSATPALTEEPVKDAKAVTGAPVDVTADRKISDFIINATINKDGTVNVQETFTYDFGATKTDELYHEFRLSSYDSKPKITATIDGTKIEKVSTVNQSKAWKIALFDNNKEGWVGVHTFEINYTAALTINEIKRNNTYNDESIKKNTIQFLDWETLLPLWKAEITDLTVNITLPEKAYYASWYNGETKENTMLEATEGNTYTYTLNDLPINSHGIITTIQFDDYVFSKADSVGSPPPKPAPTVVIAPEENKAPSFILTGVLILLAAGGLIYKKVVKKR